MLSCRKHIFGFYPSGGASYQFINKLIVQKIRYRDRVPERSRTKSFNCAPAPDLFSVFVDRLESAFFIELFPHYFKQRGKFRAVKASQANRWRGSLPRVFETIGRPDVTGFLLQRIAGSPPPKRRASRSGFRPFLPLNPLQSGTGYCAYG